MKKSFAYFTPIVLFLLCVFMGCKKYNEGPSLSFLSRKARLTNEWRLSKYVYDGKDKTEDYFIIYSKNHLTIKNDGTMFRETATNASNTKVSGTWKFVNQQYSFLFTETEFVQNSVYSVANNKHVFQILKLKRNELKFTELADGHTTTYTYVLK